MPSIRRLGAAWGDTSPSLCTNNTSLSENLPLCCHSPSGRLISQCPLCLIYHISIRFLIPKVKDSEVEKPAKVTTKKGEKDGEGTNKLYGEWQTEPWTPDPAVNGKVVVGLS